MFEKSLVIDIGGNAPNTMNPEVFARDIPVGGLAFFRSAGLASINIEAVSESRSPSQFGNTVVFAMLSGRVTTGHGFQTTPGVIIDGAQTYIGKDSTNSVKRTGRIEANPARQRLITAIQKQQHPPHQSSSTGNEPLVCRQCVGRLRWQGTEVRLS